MHVEDVVSLSLLSCKEGDLLTMNPDITFEKLYQKAVEMWGKERAEADRQNLQQKAAALKTISENLPERDQQPAFYIL